jgi:hypothetical protein
MLEGSPKHRLELFPPTKEAPSSICRNMEPPAD